jgi:hypothetical protein
MHKNLAQALALRGWCSRRPGCSHHPGRLFIRLSKIPLTITGNKNMDIEVLPYYMLSNSSFTLGSDSTVSGSCKLEKIIKDANAKDIESVTLFVNRTTFVDDDNQIANVSISGGSITDMGNIKLTTKIPAVISSIGSGTQKYFFARIGVKISGIEDMLYSPVSQIQF